MIEHGFPAKRIRLIRATLDGSKSSVQVADGISSLFVTLDELKQGETTVTRSHMLLGFADDIDIIEIDCRAVEEAFIPFKRETARIGLKINTTNTKYMIACGQRRSGRSSGEKFDVVDEFVYLGALVTYDNDVTREMKRWITAANRPLFGLRNQLKSRKLQTKKKLALEKTRILPAALYGHES